MININDSEELKGYMYDSLTYRYIRAREAMAERDWVMNGKLSQDWEKYQRQANRDIIRFCQILDEAIGGHT